MRGTGRAETKNHGLDRPAEGKRKVDEESVKELSKALRRALLEADFNVRQTKELTERIERRMMKKILYRV